MYEQYVCKVCGYNIINNHPDFCPFCGASRIHFITADVCSQKYKIVENEVKDSVTRLNSYPSLGLEHTAYCIENKGRRIWIDCPSTFSKNLKPMDKILFTHHHFLGASNLYREYYTAFIWIHKKDSVHTLANQHSFDKKFVENFEINGIKAYHINGHTPGFTIYIYEDILFICDYLLLKNDELFLNPYGPDELTTDGAKFLWNYIKKREFEKVCGFNYIMDFNDWIREFVKLLI